MMGSKNIKNWELKHWTQHSEVQWDWGRVGVRFDRFQYSHVQEAREIQGTWIIFWSSKILKVRHQPVSRWFVSWLVLFWVFQCISKVTKEASQAIWLPLQEPSADEGAACHWSIGGLGDKTPADVFFLVLPIAKWECVPSWLIKMGWTLLVLQPQVPARSGSILGRIPARKL